MAIVWYSRRGVPGTEHCASLPDAVKYAKAHEDSGEIFVGYIYDNGHFIRGEKLDRLIGRSPAFRDIAGED